MLLARVEGLPREGYIFGEGFGFGGPFSGWGKPTDRLRDVMPEGDLWTLHDIRRMVATRLHDAGVDTLDRRGFARPYQRRPTRRCGRLQPFGNARQANQGVERLGGQAGGAHERRHAQAGGVT